MQFHAKPVFFFNIFTDNPHVHVLFMGFMSGLPNYWYNGRRYNLKGVCWCVDTDPGNFCPEETVYVAFSQLLYLWDLEEQRSRGFKAII